MSRQTEALTFIGSSVQNGKRDFCVVFPEAESVMTFEMLKDLAVVVAEKLGFDWQNKSTFEKSKCNDLLEKHSNPHVFHELVCCSKDIFPEFMEELLVAK